MHHMLARNIRVVPRLLIATLALCASSSLHAQTPQPEPPTAAQPTPPKVLEPLDKAAIARIERGLNKAASQQQFWGAVLVAQEGKPLISRGFGTRLPAANPGEPGSEPIDGQTIFEIASIAKPFTAIAILQLVEKGKLALNDPIEKHLTAIKKLPKEPSGLTIRHLLSHTTGRDNDSKMPAYDEQDRDQVVRDFLTSKKLAEPGARFDYNNHAYIVLAAIIELTTGKPFEQHIKEAIFTPAGMNSTSFLTDENLKPRAAFRFADFTQVDHPWGWGYKGCGGIVSCLDDLLAFDTALREYRLLKPESVELMHQTVAEVIRPGQPATRRARSQDPIERIALGWFVMPFQTDKGLATRTRYRHTGGSRGTSAVLTRFPEDGILIVVLSGGQSSISPLISGLEWAVMRDAAPRINRP